MFTRRDENVRFPCNVNLFRCNRNKSPNEINTRDGGALIRAFVRAATD